MTWWFPDSPMLSGKINLLVKSGPYYLDITAIKKSSSQIVDWRHKANKFCIYTLCRGIDAELSLGTALHTRGLEDADS